MKRVIHYMRPDVFFVRPHHTVFEVAKILAKNNISGAPVVEKGRLIGMISLSDITKFMSIHFSQSDFISELFAHDPTSVWLMMLNVMKVGKNFSDFRKELVRMSKFQVKDMMSRSVVAIGPDAPLFEAAEKMDKYDVNRLPVVQKDRLIGIITRGDLLKALID